MLTASDPKAVLAVNSSAAEDPSQTSPATVSFLVEADRNPIGYAGVVKGRQKVLGRREVQWVGKPGLP